MKLIIRTVFFFFFIQMQHWYDWKNYIECMSVEGQCGIVGFTPPEECNIICSL